MRRLALAGGRERVSRQGVAVSDERSAQHEQAGVNAMEPLLAYPPFDFTEDALASAGVESDRAGGAGPLELADEVVGSACEAEAEKEFLPDIPGERDLTAGGRDASCGTVFAELHDSGSTRIGARRMQR